MDIEITDTFLLRSRGMLMATLNTGSEPFSPRVGDLVDLVIGDSQPIEMRIAGLEFLNRVDRSGDDRALGLVTVNGNLDDLIQIDQWIASRPRQRIAVAPKTSDK